MEKELGVKLFSRTRRGADLTAAGLAIVEDVRMSVARIDAASHRAREIGAQRAGRLTVGFASAALFEVLPRAIAALRASVPDVELVLREMSNAEQASALERGEIDIGLLHTPVPVAGRMREKLIAREPLIAVLPEMFPLAAGASVSLRELAPHGLVWLTPYRYRESWLARAHVFSARIGASLKMSPGPTPRCGDGYVVADVDALLGHWPIAFSCLIQRGAFFFALMAS